MNIVAFDRALFGKFLWHLDVKMEFLVTNACPEDTFRGFTFQKIDYLFRI